jgi:hypothetical protein
LAQNQRRKEDLKEDPWLHQKKVGFDFFTTPDIKQWAEKWRTSDIQNVTARKLLPLQKLCTKCTSIIPTAWSNFVWNVQDSKGMVGFEHFSQVLCLLVHVVRNQLQCIWPANMLLSLSCSSTRRSDSM